LENSFMSIFDGNTPDNSRSMKNERKKWCSVAGIIFY
jgi:hypothetical protein